MVNYFRVSILPLYALTAFIIGLVVGSFLNVCIYRLPRKESIAFPASHCPMCNVPLRFYDNIPVLSYLFLGGKCRYCKTPISFQYPLVELLTASLFVFTMVRFGLNWSALFYAFYLAALVIVIFIDAEHMIIPDKVTFPGMAVGVLASVFSLIPLSWNQSIIGLLVGGGFLYLAAVLSKGGMGGGDIKLAAVMGSFMGWQKAFLGILLGSFLGSIVGVALIIAGRKKRKEFIPFGPFLAWGGMVALFWGDTIILWYKIAFW